MGFTLYELCFYFAVYAFLGWCVEVSFCTVTTGGFTNRGFLHGPVCPIYGFGVVIVVLCLTPLQNNLLFLFAGSVLLTSLLEYVTGFVLEKVFHSKWWDYSDLPFNLHGYICLKFSLLWGAACVLVMKVIHPLISGLIHKIPSLLGHAALAVVLALFLADFISTVVVILKLNTRLRQISLISQKLRECSDAMGETISEETMELKEKFDKLLSQRSVFQNRILKAFPDIKSLRYDEALSQLKERLQKRSKKK